MTGSTEPGNLRGLKGRLLAALICGLLLLLFFQWRRSSLIDLPDGSNLGVLGVTAGTNHVLFTQPWHRPLHKLTFLPKKLRMETEPFQWKSATPSTVVWAKWRGLTPMSTPPEFVLIDGSGAVHPFEDILPRGYRNMTTVGEIRGVFAVIQMVNENGTVHLRVYQSNAVGGRIMAGERTLRVRY